MPKDEDRSLLIWISPVFDTGKIAWMVPVVNFSTSNKKKPPGEGRLRKQADRFGLHNG
jgi:hypothetical protein